MLLWSAGNLFAARLRSRRRLGRSALVLREGRRPDVLLHYGTSQLLCSSGMRRHTGRNHHGLPSLPTRPFNQTVQPAACRLFSDMERDRLSMSTKCNRLSVRLSVMGIGLINCKLLRRSLNPAAEAWKDEELHIEERKPFSDQYSHGKLGKGNCWYTINNE